MNDDVEIASLSVNIKHLGEILNNATADLKELNREVQQFKQINGIVSDLQNGQKDINNSIRDILIKCNNLENDNNKLAMKQQTQSKWVVLIFVLFAPAITGLADVFYVALDKLDSRMDRMESNMTLNSEYIHQNTQNIQELRTHLLVKNTKNE